MITKRFVASACVVAAAVLSSGAVKAAKLPAIQAGPSNMPPACATPGRLLAFIKDRNASLSPRFSDVALHYMTIGNQLGMRWDYAFYQMLVETGFLTFKGDVSARQNNFAGIAATGGGVPGESFRSIADGVRAHLQHLLMYAGVRVDEPVAERTGKVQSWGILDDWRANIPGPVRFDHMTRKWSPGDRGYAGDIQAVAERFLSGRCRRPDPAPEMVAGIRRRSDDATAARPRGETGNSNSTTKSTTIAQRSIEAAKKAGIGKSGLGVRPSDERITSPGSLSKSVSVLNKPGNDTATDTSNRSQGSSNDSSLANSTVGRFASNLFAAMSRTGAPGNKAKKSKEKSCRVWTASYGGQKALIIKSVNSDFVNYTVLDVNKGREKREADAYIAAYAKGGETVATYKDSTAALKKAFELCPDGKKQS